MPTALPEDLIAFEWIAQSARPLVVCDVDEVVLEFVTPFTSFLKNAGYRLEAKSFRLHGNIFDEANGAPIERSAFAEMLDAFFAEQHDWQTPVEDVRGSLAKISQRADIVFMTAMPPRHFDVRRALLDGHGLDYPMIATENPKGDVLRLIHGDRMTPVVFIDDIFRNLDSVRSHLPNTLLVNLMANRQFRALAPDPGPAVARPADWREACIIIQDFLDSQATDTRADSPA
ncbi:hypothetical protein [Pararhizobium haloflavum]|uniref:hypothetical protein n=1 Tax=Pararhizobium haloflavum TaxID=2037914 RepID=UPI000C1A62BC|nr:hypothetical protein [Pararhizobium haloflavum]